MGEGWRSRCARLRPDLYCLRKIFSRVDATAHCGPQIFSGRGLNAHPSIRQLTQTDRENISIDQSSE